MNLIFRRRIPMPLLPKTIRGRLLLGLLISLIGMLSVVISGLISERSSMLAERAAKTQNLVETAVGLAAHYHGLQQKGELDETAARAAALKAVGALRYDKDNYFWINDLNARMVMHPIKPDLDGKDLTDFKDPNGLHIFVLFAEKVKTEGGGVVAYHWPKPGQVDPVAKISYVQGFAPWGWVVGSGLYLDDLHQSWRQAAIGWGITAGLALAVSTTLAWILGHSITKPLRKITLSMRLLAQGHDVEVPETSRGDEIGDLTRAMAVFRQYLIQREEARLAHGQMLARAKTVFDHISEAVMLTDEANHIVMVNPSFTRITGYTPEEVVGKTPEMLSSGRHDRAFYQALWRELSTNGEWHGEIWNRTKSGAIYPESLSITKLCRPDGSLDGYVATFMDITDRKRREARVRWRAEHDSLTGLCNRAQFEARLADAIRIAADSSALAAVLYLDLDGFKPVNDGLGHAAGDQVLQRVAKRIEAAVRGNDVVARLGGDEFAVLVEGLADSGDAARIAGKLVSSLAQPFDIGHQPVTIGVSIGIALFPRDGASPETLLAAADGAMYEAKHQGRGGFAFARPGLGAALASIEG